MEQILLICWSTTNSTFSLINHLVKISFTEDETDKMLSDYKDEDDGDEEGDNENEEDQSETLVGQFPLHV